MYECVFLWKGLRAEYSEKFKVVGFDACLTRSQCHQDNRRTAYARVDDGRLPMMQSSAVLSLNRILHMDRTRARGNAGAQHLRR